METDKVFTGKTEQGVDPTVIFHGFFPGQQTQEGSAGPLRCGIQYFREGASYRRIPAFQVRSAEGSGIGGRHKEEPGGIP